MFTQAQSQKRYYLENAEYREKRKQQWRDYHQRNKDVRNLKAKEKVECECGSTYAKSGKSQHMRSKKHHNFINNIVKPSI